MSFLAARFPFRSRGTPPLDVWRHVAGELGGTVLLDRKGRPRVLHTPHREWVLVTDTYTQSHGETSSTFTRTRALFHGVRPLRLAVYRRNPLHGVLHLFGYRSVPMRYPQLDRTLFVRADRHDIARAMLRGTSLGQTLMRDPLRLTVMPADRRVRRTAGDAVGQVIVMRGGKVRDVPKLRAIVQICAMTLDELERHGVADARGVRDATL